MQNWQNNKPYQELIIANIDPTMTSLKSNMKNWWQIFRWNKISSEPLLDNCQLPGNCIYIYIEVAIYDPKHLDPYQDIELLW